MTIHNSPQAAALPLCGGYVQILGLQTGFSSKNRGYLAIPAVVGVKPVLHADPAVSFLCLSHPLLYGVFLLRPSAPHSPPNCLGLIPESLGIYPHPHPTQPLTTGQRWGWVGARLCGNFLGEELTLCLA